MGGGHVKDGIHAKETFAEGSAREVFEESAGALQILASGGAAVEPYVEALGTPYFQRLREDGSAHCRYVVQFHGSEDAILKHFEANNPPEPRDDGWGEMKALQSVTLAEMLQAFDEDGARGLRYHRNHESLKLLFTEAAKLV